MNLVKNDIIKLNITSATAEGSGVGKTEDGIAVFVPLSAVGDELEVRILKTKKTYAFGKIENIITPSSARIEADCPQFSKCGGCTWRHISYEEELYLPIPQLMYWAITEGFYHKICDEEGKKFTEDFGKNVFEKYIEKIIKTNEKIKIFPEFKYNKNNDLSPDFILVKGDEMIFLEAKAAKTIIQMRNLHLDCYKQEIKKAFGKAVKQCVKKEQLYLNGKMKESKDKSIRLPENIKKIYYLVVVLEDFNFPTTELFLNQISDFLSEDDLTFNKEKLLVLNVNVLEKIFEEKEQDIFDFIKYRIGQKKFNRNFVAADYIGWKKNDYQDTDAYKFIQNTLNELINDFEKIEYRV